MREEAGVSLREMAFATERDRGHLSRVERGVREATPALVAAYQAALTRGTVEYMRRRSILVGGAALPVLALTGGEIPSLVGAPEVAAIRALALDLDLGHPFGLDVAEAGLHRAAQMLHARVSPSVVADLHEAVALLADRVGWGLHEAGRDAASALTFAYRTADKGGDRSLGAHALLDLSVHTTNTPEALATLEHALAGLVRGAERANLHAVAARRAAGYDAKLAGEHLARAMDTEPTPDGGIWAEQITVSPGHLDAIIGFACYATDHPDTAVRLNRAITEMAPNRQRTRARCHTRLAGLAVENGDETAAYAHLAKALASRRSVMVAGDLRTFAKRAHAAGRVELAKAAVA
jgi:hypothetical protein